jgi:hypothetical protein
VLDVEGNNLVVDCKLCTGEQRPKPAWQPVPQYASDEPLPVVSPWNDHEDKYKGY